MGKVFLKNCAANASLDRDEVAIWKEAVCSDKSISLEDKLFVVLTHADEDAADNNRDAHETGANNCYHQGAERKRIFWASSQAELFSNAQKTGEKLSFDYSAERYDMATKKIAQLFRQGEPTTGVDKFREALYDFIRDDFPLLEEKALKALQDSYTSALEDVKRALGEYKDTNIMDKDGNSAEYARLGFGGFAPVRIVGTLGSVRCKEQRRGYASGNYQEA